MSSPGLVTRLRWRAEAAAAYALFGFSRLLGPVASSNLGAAVARAIGPLLPVSRVIARNLELCFPGSDVAWRRRIARASWDNLGRVVGEYAHLPRLKRTASGPGWELEGDAVMQEIAARGGPAIFISGHLANWELLPPVVASFGIPMSSVFREPDNPLVDALVMKFRTDALLPITPPLFPKGSEGARAALTHLVRGGFLGIMMDQKMNNGIALTFFGLRAMTAPAMARLALRHRCPIIMGRAMREGPARYRFEALPPLPLPDSGDREADVATLTQAVNDRIEAWVRERPEEWLWQHRRFDKARYRGDAAEAAALAAAG